MFRVPLTLLAFLGCLLSVVTPFATGKIIRADDEQSWQQSELQNLQGHWTTLREEKTDEGKPRRQWVELAFAGSGLKILVFDENRNQTWSNSLQMLGVERVGPVSRLILGSGEQRKAEIYYDFTGDKMTLVGRIIPRPFEGFSLSGEYQRAVK